MYLKVGYSMGWFKTSETPLSYRDRIEVGNKVVWLDIFLFYIWLHLPACKTDEQAMQEVAICLEKANYSSNNDKMALDLLMEKGVVIHANSNKELYGYIKNLKANRNGLPMYDIEAMTNSQELKGILHVDEEIPISDTQLNIWQKADNTNTIEQIFNKITDMTLSDFMDNLLYLADKFAIFIG